MKEFRSKKRTWIAFEWLLIASLVGILIFLIIWYQKDYEQMKLPEEATVYFMGQEVTYTGLTKLKFDGQGTYIDDGTKENSVDLGDSPVITESGKKLILPENMAYHRGESNAQVFRVNHFSVLEDRGVGAITVLCDDKEVNVAKGFLFNGTDLYIFLEKMSIQIGTVVIETEPLSYAKVRYQDSIELYNSGDGSYNVISAETGVTATSTRGYTIQMDTDTVKENDEEWILFSAIDVLDCLE